MIINGNNLEILPEIEKNSVDLLLTDPPYNISQKNNFNTIGRAGIDFGEWDKNSDLFSWISEAKDVLNKNGSIIVFNAWRNLGDIAKELENNGFVIKDLIRWEKSNPMPRNRDRRYIVDYEFAIWAVKKNATWVFNRQSDNYDRSEIKMAITKKSEKSLGEHPTQKPVELMENFILRHSNVGDTVLDPFMGSGSTGVACLNTNRKFFGIELDDKYFQISKKRIEKAESENKRFKFI